mgnify:FL=1|tara:strand:+ start:200 stop:874 length:675 start_codon:yes stop_codon:yes gene_type:complete
MITYNNLDDIVIFDNIISTEYQDWLLKLVDSREMLWNRSDAIVTKDLKFHNDSRNGFANTRSLYQGKLDLTTMDEHGETETKETSLLNCFFPLLFQFVQPLNIKFLMRMRVRVTPAMGTNQIQLPHIDCLTSNTWNIIYYLNDTDGDTVIYNERSKDLNESKLILSKDVWTIKNRVTPKKGRAVAFKGDLFHSSSHSKYEPRFIVNINVCENSTEPVKNMLKYI